MFKLENKAPTCRGFRFGITGALRGISHGGSINIEIVPHVPPKPKHCQ